jgi:hypothetical protein
MDALLEGEGERLFYPGYFARDGGLGWKLEVERQAAMEWGVMMNVLRPLEARSRAFPRKR